MFLQVAQLLLIVIDVEQGVKLLELKLLSVKPAIRLHHVVSIAKVPLWELNLVKLVLYHGLVSEHVVKRPSISVRRGKLSCFLEQAIFLVVVLIGDNYISEAAGRGTRTRDEQSGLASVSTR